MSLLDKTNLLITPNAVKSGKLYSVIPASGTGDLTVVRNTTATRVNSSGLVVAVAANIARINYLTAGGEGFILNEPQATNLKSFSEAILSTNAYNVTNCVLETVSITNPFGLSASNLLKLNSGAFSGNTNDGFNFGFALVLPNNTQHTQSLFVKPFGSNVLRLRNNAIGGTADFILTGAGTAPANIIGIQAATILAYVNGWYRISWTFTTGTTAPSNRADFYAIKADVADGVNGIYVFGAQLELGGIATSYIPTPSSSAVTRNADLITKIGISSLIGQTSGVLFIESAVLFNDSTFKAISISDGTSNNRLFVAYANALNQLNISGTSQGVVFSTSITVAITNATVFSKIALKYNSTKISIFIDGVKIVNEINGQSLPINLSRFGFDSGSGSSQFFGKIRGLHIYGTALTDAECITLTT